MWSFRVLICKEKSLILDSQKEKEKESLLLFMDCVNSNMNSQSASKKERERQLTNTNMPQYSKHSIFHESKSKFFEYNEAYLSDSLALNLLGLRLLI